MKQYLIGFLAMTFILVSCKKESTHQPDLLSEFHNLGEATMGDGKLVTLYSLEPLTTGYNPIFIKVTDGNRVVSPESLNLTTLMDMGTMKHSSPSVNPVYNPVLGAFESGAILTMPSSAQEWSITIQSGSETAVFKTNVLQTKTKVVGNFTASDGNVYVMAVYPFKDFKVGMNDFSVVVYKKESAMKFTPASGLNVEFYPYMTSMDHGSPNNVNPKEATQGFYNGRVNFTMTGDWRLHFKVAAQTDVLLEDAALDIVF